MDATPQQPQRGLMLLNISCSSCGAPAAYDIAKHSYACAYCGNLTGIDEALQQKKGFRSLHRKRRRESASGFGAVKGTCSGCGAEVAFPANEPLQSCSFCGRALVRGEYLQTPNFPELIIPFRLTADEARERLQDWCARNSGKPEAKHLQAHFDEMQGYYLPYELIRGPIDCLVSRAGTERTYSCGGFLTSVFVNTSEQLDNLTLNGMEPYDLDELREFDFGYLAQQKAKVDEIGAKALEARVRQEVAASYRPEVQKALETKSVDISPRTENLLRMPVLLPVYYISAGDVRAAVNGQTGKVAVRSEQVRKTAPWWIRPIVATLAVFVAAFAVASLLLGDWETGIWIAGAFTLVMGLILYTAYSNAHEGEKRRVLDPEIFTSTEIFERGPDGPLHASAKRIVEDPVEPMFFERIDGVATPVEIRFTTPARMLKMVLLALGVACLPILIAFALNGLSPHGLHPEGSAVWLCIFVPITIAYFFKFGRIGIYENPYVYTIDEQGRKRRVKTRPRADSLREIAGLFLTPPLVFVTLALLLFLVMGVYLTLGN